MHSSSKIFFAKSGFGFVSILITLGIIVFGFYGFMYITGLKNQKTTLETGTDTIKQAEQLKQTLEQKNKEMMRDAEDSKNNSDRTTSIDTSTWKTYRNEQYGFEVRYPNDWELKFEEPFTFTNSKGYVHGLGIPDFGEMSFTIVPETKASEFVCESTNEYSTYADWPGLLPMEKRVCLYDIAIILEYTDHYKNSLTSMQVENNKRILEEILSTFKFIK